MDKYEKLKAVAIKYEKEDNVPKIVGKGTGYLGEKIVEKGKNSDVPIIENKQLVEDLLNVELGDNIPKELYQVVAEILVFIEDLDRGTYE